MTVEARWQEERRAGIARTELLGRAYVACGVLTYCAFLVGGVVLSRECYQSRDGSDCWFPIFIMAVPGILASAAWPLAWLVCALALVARWS